MIPLVRERKALVFHIIRPIANIFLSPIFRIKAGGQENLPSHSAFILLPKHQRWEDTPLLSLAVPRPLYYIAKYELFINPISSWFLSALGGIPLNRSRPIESRQSLKAVVELLGEGEGVVVFPEGTCYRNRMGPGHPGLIRMIRSHSASPFIPVGICYSAKRWCTEVHVNFGRPIYEDSSDRADILLAEIMKEIARLSGL